MARTAAPSKKKPGRKGRANLKLLEAFTTQPEERACNVTGGVLKNKPLNVDPNGIFQHAPGAKLDAGKLMAGLGDQFSLALSAMLDIATYGAMKYTVGGWQTVPDGAARYWNAFNRHRLAMAYEEVDSESGRLHLHHALWNLMAIVEMQMRKANGLTMTDQMKWLTGETK